MKPRHMLMLAALAVAAWFAFFGDKTPNSDVAEPAKRSAAASASAKNAPAQRSAAAASDDTPRATEKDGAAKKHKRDIVILAVHDRKELIGGASSGNIAGLFGTQSWTPPPPPPPVNAGPPPPPTAPELPFTFLGKKNEDAKWEVYLAHGDTTLIVQEKSVIEGTYRVDSIKPPLLTLTYLPMNQQQTLPIGGTE